MAQPTKVSARGDAAIAAPRANPTSIAILAWLVPGAGHLAVGQFRKAVVFFVVLTGMFLIGLAFGGQLFAFTPAEPLVLLAGLAEWALGLPRALAGIAGAGRGNVVAITYEYGNTFLIVSGLLNTLVVLDAVDRARGVKA
jgi:hypothetical protein